MATVKIPRDNFVEVVENNPIVFVDFWADWCVPCLRFGPVFEAASEQHTSITFGKVDTEDQPELAGGMEIQAIPTLMAFRDGYLVYREAGALSASQFTKLIDAVQNLDMEKLKTEAEARAEA